MAASQAVDCDGHFLSELVDRGLAYLRGLAYQESTLQLYRQFWRRFLRFAARDRVADRSLTGLIDRYLDACGRVTNTECKTLSSQLKTRTMMRMLLEFGLHGCIQSKRRTGEKPVLVARHAELLSGYLRFCEQQLGSSPGTCYIREVTVHRFLHYLDARGVDVTQAGAEVVSGYMLSRAHLATTSIKITVGSLRSFARYLLVGGKVTQDFVDLFRAYRCQPRRQLPSAWTREEVERLLAAVDRGSPAGKRDYAILLLAAELGMRSGDIRDLRLENIHWEEGRVEFTQGKTGNLQSLPISESLGAALIDYLRNGRPPSKHREVFLRACAPYDPLDAADHCYHIITKYRQRANIAVTPRARKCGLHALRHSLASRLIEAGASFEAMAGVLGHRELRSTQSYVRIDVEALRSVALDPDEVVRG